MGSRLRFRPRPRFVSLRQVLTQHRLVHSHVPAAYAFLHHLLVPRKIRSTQREMTSALSWTETHYTTRPNFYAPHECECDFPKIIFVPTSSSFYITVKVAPPL